MTQDLRFPIGKFIFPTAFSAIDTEKYLSIIEELPEKLTNLVSDLSDNQLDMSYRSQGWTIRQVVHHLVDSHMNSYIRFKLALTEENPTIRPYFENHWAELPDTFETPIEVSLQLLKNLHQRWIILLKSISKKDLNRVFTHPEMNTTITLWQNIALYAWHSEHHLAHVKQALKTIE